MYYYEHKVHYSFIFFLMQTLQTTFCIPKYSDDAIQLDDSYLYLSYEPYSSPSIMHYGTAFYSVPLDEFSKEDIVLMVKEGVFMQMVKNKKLGPLQKVTYDGEILIHEETLEPNGSPEPLLKWGRMHRQASYDIKL